MERQHINERGNHTSVIEGARDVLACLRKVDAEISPGEIRAKVGSHVRSIKLKRLNDETFEMVVVVNGSRQVFKVYGENQNEIEREIGILERDGWIIHAPMDLSRQ